MHATLLLIPQLALQTLNLATKWTILQPTAAAHLHTRNRTEATWPILTQTKSKHLIQKQKPPRTPQKKKKKVRHAHIIKLGTALEDLSSDVETRKQPSQHGQNWTRTKVVQKSRRRTGVPPGNRHTGPISPALLVVRANDKPVQIGPRSGLGAHADRTSLVPRGRDFFHTFRHGRAGPVEKGLATGPRRRR